MLPGWKQCGDNGDGSRHSVRAEEIWVIVLEKVNRLPSPKVDVAVNLGLWRGRNF